MHKRLIEQNLNQIRDKLLVMGGAAEKAIMLSMRALEERDSSLAERVIREDDAIDGMELELDQMCVDVLVLKQPAASDLRFMLIDGLDSFTSGDPDKARATIERDDEVDSLYDLFYSELITAMSRDSSLVERGVQWLSVIKHLERIADYVTNICEQIVYMARGQVIKHSVW